MEHQPPARHPLPPARTASPPPEGFALPPVPEGFPPYRPAWLYAKHLQTAMAQCLVGRGAMTKDCDERIEVPLDDGSGDRLIAKLRMPGEPLPGAPLVVLLHGLGGSADSPYLRSCAGDLRTAGYRTLLVNLRGCGESAEVCRRIHHPERTGDLRCLFRVLERHDGGRLAQGGFFPIGMSLGGDTLLKFLARDAASFAIRGAAAVSPTLDLAATTAKVETQWLPYARFLLRWMKQETNRPSAELTVAERRRIAEARTITEFHERFTAPHFGHADAAGFYASCSPVPELHLVRIPTAIFYSRDDPLVPPYAYHAIDWGGLPRLLPFLVERGGHVGFRQVSGWCWHNACLLHLLAAASPATSPLPEPSRRGGLQPPRPSTAEASPGG